MILLSIPMVLEMIMESVFALADILFLSMHSTAAVATVGITESLITIVYSIAVGLSMATTATVSRRIGEKQYKKAAQTSAQAIVTGVFASLLIAVPGIIYAEDLLLMMGTEAQIASEMSGYTKIMLGGNAIIMLLFIINAIFRSSGDAALSLRVLFLANLLNIILDPCLIFGLGPFPELGVEGAAIATNIGRGIAVVFQFYLLFRGNHRIKLVVEHFKIQIQTIQKLIKLSVGVIFQYLISTSSWIFLVKIVAEFGTEAIAGYTIAIRIIIFALLPSWGLSNAAATLVGQNLGAKNPERAEKAVWFASKINFVLLVLLGSIIYFFPDTILAPFLKEDPNVDTLKLMTIATNSLKIISLGFAAYGIGMVMMQSFNGSGDTKTPTWINFFAFWVLEIPLAYVLSHYTIMGVNGVFWSIIIAEAFLTVIAMILFKRGKWKKSQV
jgi:putative MATE family efflux protein